MAEITIGRNIYGQPIFYGIAADLAAKTAVINALAEYWLDDGSRYQSNGAGGWKQTHAVGGAMLVSIAGSGVDGVLVTTSVSGTSHVRQEAALDGTAKTFDFGAAGISELSLAFFSEAQPATGVNLGELPASVAVTLFNPPNDTVRDAWLTPSDSLTTDSYMIVMSANKLYEPFRFSSPIRYVGMKRLFGSEVLTAIGVGTEVTA